MKFITTLLSILTISLSLFISPVFAHGPTPQKIDEKITIHADVKTVWNKVKAFDSLAQWHPMVASIEMTDKDTRIVTLKTGGTITDSLDEVNEEEHLMSYRLLEEDVTVFPVSFYTISLQVEPTESGDGASVSWSGRFYRGDTGNFPPENLNDETAVKAMEAYAKAGLEGLKRDLEK